MNINLKRLINQNKLFNALKMFILNFRNTYKNIGDKENSELFSENEILYSNLAIFDIENIIKIFL